MTQVVVYVDGFNLYNGLKEKFGRKYLWLDLELLVNRLLKPYQQVEAIRYFTASVRDAPDALHRQSQYIGALESHSRRVEIRFGRFQEKKMRCYQCGARWKSYEEKETDVGIAVGLLEDGVNDLGGMALLVSADSDLCPAVRALKQLRPNIRVVAAFPPKRRSDELRHVVDGSFTISDNHIRNSLLPDTVRNARTGVVYTRPRRWR